MKNPSERDRLIDDILAEGQPAGIEDELLQSTLRHARARRWRRRAWPILAGVGAVMVALALVRQWRASTPIPAAGSSAGSGVAIVRTAALPPPAIVHTTAASGRIRLIGDAELLAIAAPHQGRLVRTGPDSEELRFVNPADRAGFRL